MYIEHIPAEEVWDIFQYQIRRMPDEPLLVGESDTTDVSIAVFNDDGIPYVIVYRDDEEVFGENAFSKTDLESVISHAWEVFFKASEEKEMIDSWEEEREAVEQFEEIEYREDELDIAVMEFLDVVMDGEAPPFNEESAKMYADIKEHFLEYVYKKHGLSPRRPMFLEDENGEDFYTEYPYPCMI